MTDSQPLLLPSRRIRRDLTIEITLVGGDGDGAGLLDDHLAVRHQHLIEGQWRDIGSASSAEGVAAGLERSSVAATFACCLHQGDVAIAGTLERSRDLDEGSDDQSGGTDQRARRRRPSVDVDQRGRS